MKTLIVLFVLLTSVFARADWNPSDNISPEIQSLATEALNMLTGHEEQMDIVVKAMLKELPKVQAYLTDEDLVANTNGQSQDSVGMNFPKLGLIVMNRARWAKITSLPFRRAIALHEVASLMNIESTGVYPLSTSYLSFAGLSADDFKRAITSDSSIATADGFSRAGCPWAADRLMFFFEVWTSSVENCQNQTGLISNEIASFKERRLREAMKLTQRNCSADAKVLSDVVTVDSLITSYKKTKPAVCTQ